MQTSTHDEQLGESLDGAVRNVDLPRVRRCLAAGASPRHVGPEGRNVVDLAWANRPLPPVLAGEKGVRAEADVEDERAAVLKALLAHDPGAALESIAYRRGGPEAAEPIARAERMLSVAHEMMPAAVWNQTLLEVIERCDPAELIESQRWERGAAPLTRLAVMWERAGVVRALAARLPVDLLGATAWEGTDALGVAITKGDAELVEILLGAGAGPQCSLRGGRSMHILTALVETAMTGAQRQACLDVVLRAGIDPTVRDPATGWTARERALERVRRDRGSGLERAVELLKAAEANQRLCQAVGPAHEGTPGGGEPAL